MSDTKALRRYQAGVERALGLFDTSNEWADYIAFLSRLLKALQASPSGAEVPSKTILARYLAQCLRPSLPSGVHQKALEVYGLIFSLIGKEGLSADLPLYFPGLAHTLSFASLSTRPWFLSLFDDHILKLSSQSLRPALKAVLLSLLPGVEEENSEDFEKTLATINRVRAIFTNVNIEDVFWQSLFLASVTSTNRRMGVLVYLTRYLPRLGPPQSENASTSSDQQPADTRHTVPVVVVTTPEPGLLIRCFATGLQDDQPLVQRGFLDLLVTHFPLNSTVIQEAASAKDVDIIISAALSIVLKRDMGLNRRLWAWFLGADDKSNLPEHTRKASSGATNGLASPADQRNLEYPDAQDFFQRFGQLHIISTFKTMLSRQSPAPSQRARPFRILVSLMDRTSIGAPVVDVVFQQLIDDLKNYQINAPSQGAFDEVFRSANVFFDSIDPHMIAKHLLELFQANRVDLLDFVVSNFSLEDDDLVRKHIPLIVSVMSQALSDDCARDGVQAGITQHHPKPEVIRRILSFLVGLLPIQANVVVDGNQLSEGEGGWTATVQKLYQSSHRHDLVSPGIVAEANERSLRDIMRTILAHLTSSSNPSPLDDLAAAFEILYARSGSTNKLDIETFLKELAAWAASPFEIGPSAYGLSSNVVALLTSILRHTEMQHAAVESYTLSIIPDLVHRFWRNLAPSSPQFHVESVEMIWTLRSMTAGLPFVDSTIMSLLGGTYGRDSECHPAIRFGVFWTHSRPAQVLNSTLAVGSDAEAGKDRNGLLSRAAVYLIDAVDENEADDPYRVWMVSLSSLAPHYQIILDGIRRDHGESQEVAIRLHRLSKMIPICRSSPSLWKEFTDASGSANFILKWVIALMTPDKTSQKVSLGALGIVAAIYEGGGYPVDNTLLEMLAGHLSNAESSSRFQARILDVLQPLVALQKAHPPPLSLFNTLVTGIASPGIDADIDKWITLLCNTISLYPDSVFFANLLRLTDCFCRRIQQYFEVLKNMYRSPSLMHDTNKFSGLNTAANPERSIINLMAGLEYILARAHTQIMDSTRPASTQEPTSTEASQLRSLANNRLTVVLCMQDAIKISGQVWCWRPPKEAAMPVVDTKSFSYLSSKLRTRTRRMLEHLIEAEPQECLETLIGIWTEAVKANSYPGSVMNLLQTLESARPRFMMPAIFNAIYNRTNPQALDYSQKSTLSVDLAGPELVAFLIDYVRSLEADLLEEIWSNCTSFLRDILANPMPHRQLLLRLIDFTSTLCQKMENTTFGEQSRMRRELADLCTRLFTAVFTIKPVGLDASTSPNQPPNTNGNNKVSHAMQRFNNSSGIVILLQVLPTMTSILTEGDRISTIFSGISAHITGPLLRAKAFPQNITEDVIQLLVLMSKTPSVTKIWRKDVLDTFNNQNFFQNSDLSGELGWPSIMKQLAAIDKGLMVELLGRLTAPTTAGIVFGVGATAARAEADKQTKINLRRLALLLLGAEMDTFASSLGQIVTKIDELLTATPTTSPSSAMKSEIYLLLRAICLSFSPLNLVALWPTIDSELRILFEDMNLGDQPSLSTYAHLEGAKLLDLLLLLKPEEFQLHEWLFITDTIDAIYPPANMQSIASADSLRLDDSQPINLSSSTDQGLRKPWLCTDETRNPLLQSALLGSFFSHLSIRAFEDTYSLEPADIQACRRDILLDLFSDGD